MASKLYVMRICALAGVAGVALSAGLPVQAQTRPIDLRNSFPVGSNGLCEAQILAPEEGAGLFDRRYAIVCRDAAAPVGTLWVVRDPGADAGPERFAPAGASCAAIEEREGHSLLPDAQVLACNGPNGGIPRELMIGHQGNRTYAASGLAVYRDALRLGLATLAANRPVEGDVSIPLTQSSDAQAFARAQAEAISADAAMGEAYRRSNAGSFADAAEFFAASAEALGGASGAEALLNSALQQSNLGNHVEASRLFGRAEMAAAGDPVLARMARNYQAIDALNRDAPGSALEILARALPGSGGSDTALRSLEIDAALSSRLAAEQGGLLAGEGSNLTPLERSELLDGQADYIRATALRLTGDTSGARSALENARQQLANVRGGQVASILWLRAQTLAELAEIEERAGNPAAAEGFHREAVSLLETGYPGSPVLLSARAQLAGLLARTGREDEAIELYRDLVAKADSKPAGTLRRLLAPYFRLLASRGNGEAIASDMFAASQLMVRPGLAQTQAILARELSGGSDEASQLFRRSINLTRSVEKVRASIAQLEARVTESPQLATALADRRAELESLQQRQLETQQQLGEYPKYRVVSDDRMELADLQSTLRDWEAYAKLVMLDDAAYAIFAGRGGASAYRMDTTPDKLELLVDTLRASIALEEGGQTITYPFDIEASRELFGHLFGPVQDRLANVEHLIFEPDGAMLRLPANLLVMDDASVERYAQRLDANPDADPYDFRGTNWLGRAMEITTAVSPTAFRDVRKAPASDASFNYIGFGQNSPIGEGIMTAGGVRSGAGMDTECQWSAATWNDPIEADELVTAGAILGDGRSAIVTGDSFTDTAVKQLDNLDEYRIMHFATHGLVTAPRPQCPPRPALLTSFGAGESDGLLSFSEIYDLKIDADLVVLSACNTAGRASSAATQEAGVTSGGDFALDGLVRAFVGAGGRTVVASHWPVPDEYDATKRLITGIFEAQPGVTTAQALRQSQFDLMDTAETSHPFYWSAFAIVGDGSIPVRRD